VCRQRATHNQAAMRAASLVVMALGENSCPSLSWEDLLCHI
jgi:hypothetical protein